jgi:hypothetical protein
MHVFDDMMKIDRGHAPLAKRKSLLKIAHNSDSRHLSAIDAQGFLMFVRSTTDV